MCEKAFLRKQYTGSQLIKNSAFLFRETIWQFQGHIEVKLIQELSLDEEMFHFVY